MSAPRKAFAVAAGIAMFGAAVALLAAVAHIPKPVLDDGLGPRMLPALVAGFLLVLAMGFTQAAWQGRVPDAVNDPEEAPDPGGLARAGWLVAGLVTLFCLLAFTGVGLAGMAGFALFAKAFGSRSFPHALLIGAILTLVVWALFDQLLGVQLGGLIHVGSWRLG
ncbi:tripartite tricarboxylate transporter TctB family protein [Uliginosibacterium paludis]|uniref:Tripartite tricarboxylate transporter TctB family protein n=1 Tax=Uliginosibacterium paludis TaxID=1615952 RepID=A0ABV2CSN0_9RHOO